MNYKEDLFPHPHLYQSGTGSPLQPHVCLKVAFTNTPSLDSLQPPSPARTRTGRLPRTQPPALSQTSGNHHTLSGRTLKELIATIFSQSSFTHLCKEVPLQPTKKKTKENESFHHFSCILLRIIAEMTEEEIVSTIGSPKYRNKKSKKAYAASSWSKERKLQTRREEETAFRHLLRQLPGKAYQSEPCQISGIYRDRHRPSQQRRISTYPPNGQEMRLHPHRLYQPQRDGPENHSAHMPAGWDIARNHSGNRRLPSMQPTIRSLLFYSQLLPDRD